MIQANELRIGNYVYDVGGQPSKVVRLTEEKIPLASPIPLTPEILEKAGFDCGDDDSRNDFWKDDFRVAFHIHDGVIEWCNERLHEGLIPLHQLQNLYFALTGEELPIEL